VVGLVSLQGEERRHTQGFLDAARSQLSGNQELNQPHLNLGLLASRTGRDEGLLCGQSPNLWCFVRQLQLTNAPHNHSGGPDQVALPPSVSSRIPTTELWWCESNGQVTFAKLVHRAIHTTLTVSSADTGG
jgi:hypothetical protein